MGSPAVAEGGGEAMSGGRGESGEKSEVQGRSSLTSTAPKARSRSREVATLDEAPRFLLRVSSNFYSFFGFESTQLARQLHQERTQMEAQ